MFPRNLTLFRFPAHRYHAHVIDDALDTRPLKPVGALELSSVGFVSPYGHGSDVMTAPAGNNLLLTLGGEHKVLPSAAINAALAAKINAYTDTHGRRPNGAERKRIKEDVLHDILPRALVKPSRTNALLFDARGWLAIDTSSRKLAETVVISLREALGSFPALPACAEVSPRATMTAWLAGEPLPEGFALGDEALLRDPADTTMAVRITRHDLLSNEFAEHLKAGKQAFSLGLTWRGRLSFVLGEDLVIRKLKFLDAATEQLEHGNFESLAAELDAVAHVAAGEIGELLDALESVLHLGRAE